MNCKNLGLLSGSLDFTSSGAVQGVADCHYCGYMRWSLPRLAAKGNGSGSGIDIGHPMVPIEDPIVVLSMQFT